MNGVARHAGGPRRGRQGVLVEPARVILRRPRHGWIAGLLGAGVMAAAVLAATVLALSVLTGVTVMLWWAGQARVPVLVLVYGSVAVAGGGFALGRASRWSARWPRLPEGPDQLAWQPGAGRVEAGLVWEQDDEPAITGPDGPAGEEGRQ